MDKAARITASVMLFLALLHWPYSYYQLLRWVVCGVCAWSAFLAYETKRTGWTWNLGGVAVLFNPIAPIYIARSLWSVIDIAVGIALLCFPASQKEAENSPP